MIIKEREGTWFKYLNDSKVLIEYSNDMDDIPGKYGKTQSKKTRKVMVVFDDMIAGMLSNKKN